MSDALTMAVYSIGAIAAMPLVAVTLGAMAEARRKRRSQAMMDRFYSKLYR